MRKMTASLFATAVLFFPLEAAGAGVELSGWWTNGWPQGKKLSSYGYGIITTGGTGRLSRVIGEGHKPFNLLIFAEIGILDFGPEAGYIVTDFAHPELGLDIASDHYLLNFSTGLALAGNTGEFQPYLNILGGVTYHSAISRILSRRGALYPVSEMFEINGATWHAGLGVGIKILIWKPDPQPRERLLDGIFFDVHFGCLRGGNTEYLDWRTVRETSGSLDYEFSGPDINILILSFGISLLF